MPNSHGRQGTGPNRQQRQREGGRKDMNQNRSNQPNRSPGGYSGQNNDRDIENRWYGNDDQNYDFSSQQNQQNTEEFDYASDRGHDQALEYDSRQSLPRSRQDYNPEPRDLNRGSSNRDWTSGMDQPPYRNNDRSNQYDRQGNDYGYSGSGRGTGGRMDVEDRQYGPGSQYGGSRSQYGPASRYDSGSQYGTGSVSRFNTSGSEGMERQNFASKPTAGSQQSFAGRGPQGYKRSDERITEDINEEMTQAHDLDASNITVETKNGEVTLKGSVPDRESKRRAEDIAESCSGVKDVQNQIRVKRENMSDSSSSDSRHDKSDRSDKNDKNERSTKLAS